MAASETDIEWEARRVAAAFGVGEWGEDVWFMNSTDSLFLGKKDGLEVLWRINAQGYAIHFRVGNGGSDDCMVTWRKTMWWLTMPRCYPQYNELMARALFCLGIEDEDVLAKLNHPLSAHEQMELRLDMPREFWPLNWGSES